MRVVEAYVNAHPWVALLVFVVFAFVAYWVVELWCRRTDDWYHS